MRRNTFALLLVACMMGLAAGPVLADGIIIIDPPPIPSPPEWSPWLTIRYHRVHVTITDQVATTHVDQVFRNDSSVEAEGTYVFPLPEGAVVQHFVMWVDGKPLEGEVLPADKARAIYEEYVRRRQDPALLEYVGRDAVQARIFPIPPGEERRIELEYTQVLPVENGLMHYRYPLDTERFSALPLEQVSVFVELASQTPIRALYSSSHQDEIIIRREGERKATVSYEASHIYPDRDFDLYTGFGDQEIGASLLTYRPGMEDGFFLLMLSPSLEVERVLPQDILLVLDTSGSMEGEKLAQAKEALRYILRHLNPEDRFNVIAFSSSVQSYASGLRSPAEANAAADWVSKLAALGGTNIYLALSETLRQAEVERPTVVIFLTDGLPTEGITDEDVLLSTLAQEAPESVHLFPFGVGYDVNTLLLDQLAEEHKGRPAYVEPDERLDEIVSAFYARIQSPVLTDITLDFGNVTVYDVYPQPLPHLYAGTQLIVTGRYTGDGPQKITLTGEVAGQRRTYTYEGNFARKGGSDFIPRLWAARKIGYLLTQIRLHGEQAEWVDAVVALSLRYGIITPYTSFLVQNEDALTSYGRENAAEELVEMPTLAASGADAVQEAKSREGLSGVEAPPAAQEVVPGHAAGEEGGVATTIRYAGDKTFLCRDATCTDTVFVPDQMETVAVRFGSETYWQLLTNYPDWNGYLALAPEVIFVSEDGTVYHVQPGDDVVEDTIPQPQADATPTQVPTQPSETPSAEETPSAAPAPSTGGSGLCSGTLALAALSLLIGMLILRR